jgi:NADH:ubiquinone reductase (H+-translocating)
MKNVIIVGAGFAGLKLANTLNNKPYLNITLIDRFNYHQFQPLFYQVATAGIDASSISFPLRKVFQNSDNVRISMADLQQVNTTEQKITTSIGEMNYDYLVLATGADTNFFGNKNLMDHTLPMKSTVEALNLRNRLIQNFENAANAKTEEERNALLNVVVVGAGPTGVELSGAIAEMKRYVLPKDFPEIDFEKMNIYLLEGSDKTLAAMSEKSQTQSQKYLEKLGVQVLTKTIVKNYDGKTVELADGKTITTATVIWAAGIKGNVPAGIDQSLITRGNRIKVDRLNKVQGMDNVYALGDLAYMETEKYPAGHPQVANVAINQAKMLGNNLIKMQWNPKTVKEFEYADKGSMATVGRNLAVVDVPFPKLHFGGFFAWLIWMGLHLVLLLGVKNRLQVLMNWMYNYLTYDQNLRLIFKDKK